MDQPGPDTNMDEYEAEIAHSDTKASASVSGPALKLTLDGKVALVTGSGQGLGKAFCNALLLRGAKVCISDVNDETGKAAQKEFERSFGDDNVVFQKADVTSRKQMEALFAFVKKKFGSIDIVVNNAGINGEVYPQCEKVVDVNVKGTMTGTMLALEAMRRDKGGNGGVIVNISSMTGIYPNPFGPVYSATKFAIVGFSRSWAMNPDVTNNGVRINVLCPSWVDTALFGEINSDNCLNVPAVKAVKDQFGVLASDQVAEALVELIEDDTKNGAVLKIRKYEGKVYYK